MHLLRVLLRELLLLELLLLVQILVSVMRMRSSLLRRRLVGHIVRRRNVASIFCAMATLR